MVANVRPELASSSFQINLMKLLNLCGRDTNNIQYKPLQIKGALLMIMTGDCRGVIAGHPDILQTCRLLQSTSVST